MESEVIHLPDDKPSHFKILTLRELGDTIIQATHAREDTRRSVCYLLNKKLEAVLSTNSFLQGNWNALLKILVDPELLVDYDALFHKIREKQVSNQSTLSQDDPLFALYKPRRTILEEFGKNLAKSTHNLAPQELSYCLEALHLVANFYDTYVFELIDLANTIIGANNPNVAIEAVYLLLKHLESKALLLGDVFKDKKYWRVSQTVARHICQINTQGSSLEKSSNSNHKVSYLPEDLHAPHVYFKSDGFPPLRPGEEAKTHHLYANAGIPITTPGFIILYNVMVNHRFVDTPFFLQVTNGIQGQSGKTAIIDENWQQTLKTMDRDLYVKQTVGTLLTDPSDQKPHNFIFHDETMSFIGVDNDEVFNPILNRNDTINLKSMLLALPLMDEVIPPTTRHHFMRDPEVIVLSLDYDIEKRNKRYQELFSFLSFILRTPEPDVLESLKKQFSLPISLSPESKKALIERLDSIATQLAQAGTTCQALFKTIHPAIAKGYEILRKECKTPQAVIAQLFHPDSKGSIYDILYRIIEPHQKRTLQQLQSTLLQTFIETGTESPQATLVIPILDRVMLSYLTQWDTGFFDPTMVLKDLKVLLALEKTACSDQDQGLQFLKRGNEVFAALDMQDKDHQKYLAQWRLHTERLKEINPHLNSGSPLLSPLTAQHKTMERDHTYTAPNSTVLADKRYAVTTEALSEDVAKEITWYLPAAEDGNIDALFQVGMRYVTAHQYTKAVECLQKTTEKGHMEGSYMLGLCFYNGKDGKDHPGTAEECFKKAVACFGKAAKQGHAPAQYCLGICYYNGEGVKRDFKIAAKLFRNAADQDHAEAQDMLGDCYYNGRGVDPDQEEAARWYQQAADQGDANAQYSLAICYYNGHGVQQDFLTARTLLQKAAHQGNTSAKNMLIQLFPEQYNIKI